MYHRPSYKKKISTARKYKLCLLTHETVVEKLLTYIQKQTCINTHTHTYIQPLAWPNNCYQTDMFPVYITDIIILQKKKKTIQSHLWVPWELFCFNIYISKLVYYNSIPSNFSLRIFIEYMLWILFNILDSHILYLRIFWFRKFY